MASWFLVILVYRSDRTYSDTSHLPSLLYINHYQIKKNWKNLIWLIRLYASHLELFGKNQGLRERERATTCPLRRTMLFHCGPVAAAASTFLLMSIGSAMALLPDDSHNATVLCLWPQNNAPPPMVQFLSKVQTILMQTPWACESSGKCPLKDKQGEDMATTSGNTCRSGMYQYCTLPGANLGGVWRGAKGKVFQGEWARYQDKNNKSKGATEQPRFREYPSSSSW